MSSSPGKSKKPASAASPKKKSGKRTSLNVPTYRKPVPILTAFAFHPDLSLEGYTYTRDDNNDAYTHEYKLVVTNKKTCEYLTNANFISFGDRRDPDSMNEALINERDNFRRCVLCRFIPEGVSTTSTRAEGLEILKRFFMDPAYAKFPPSDIITLDGTIENDPHPLDAFFLDDMIKIIITREFDDEELNSKFYSKYPKLAKKLWSGTFYSTFAMDLGFPSL